MPRNGDGLLTWYLGKTSCYVVGVAHVCKSGFSIGKSQKTKSFCGLMWLTLTINCPSGHAEPG